jgi:hypothetical protein
MALNHSSRDAEHKNAVVLKAYVEAQISGRHKGQRVALPLSSENGLALVPECEIVAKVLPTIIPVHSFLASP